MYSYIIYTLFFFYLFFIIFRSYEHYDYDYANIGSEEGHKGRDKVKKGFVESMEASPKSQHMKTEPEMPTFLRLDLGV